MFDGPDGLQQKSSSGFGHGGFGEQNNNAFGSGIGFGNNKGVFSVITNTNAALGLKK